MSDWIGKPGENVSLASLLASEGDSCRDIAPYGPDSPIRGHAIASTCTMLEGLCLKHGIVRQSSTVSPHLRMIFLLGTGIHQAMQDSILAPYLVGAWRCRGCSKQYNPPKGQLMRRPSKCTKSSCANSNYSEDVKSDWHLPGFAYIEPVLNSEKPYVQGHADGVMCISDLDKATIPEGDEGLEVIEIKSTSSPDAIIPLSPDHETQLNIYMGLMGIHKGRVIYVRKTGTHLHGILSEHIVRFDAEAYGRNMQRLQAIEDAVEADDLSVLERSCSKADCARSKKCPVSDLCWQIGK